MILSIDCGYGHLFQFNSLNGAINTLEGPAAGQKFTAFQFLKWCD